MIDLIEAVEDPGSLVGIDPRPPIAHPDDDIIGVDADGTWIFDAAGTAHGDVGPTLDLPHLFGEQGGVSLGVREGFGWTGGPIAFAQALWSPSRGLRLLLRADYMSTTYVGRVGDRFPEGGLYGSVNFDITHNISARVALMGSTGFGTGAVTGSAGVNGRF